MEITKLSPQGQVIIPQSLREAHQWEVGQEFIINDSKGAISKVSLKVLIAGSSYLLVKATIPIMVTVGSKVAISLAAKAGAKMAAKTGGLVAAKIGANFVDPIIGVGIIAWDLWDYHHTVTVNRPILRAAILDYLTEVNKSLLNNPENGIMASIYQLEGGILKSIQSANYRV